MPGKEVKARTKASESKKNAQNFLNDRIKKANGQLAGEGNAGRVVIQLLENTTTNGAPVTKAVAKDLISTALSKGGRGTHVVEVIVKGSDGAVIYRGQGK